MIGAEPGVGTMWDRWRMLNAVALGLAVLLLVGLALLWSADRRRPAIAPAWGEGRFAVVHAGDPAADGRERWIVAVQPDCGHCTEHLGWLASRLERRERPPALGVLLVDLPRRPPPDLLAAALPAGVWWDSAGAWRREWARRAYGETYRFAADGRYLGATPAGVMPDSLVAP